MVRLILEDCHDDVDVEETYHVRVQVTCHLRDKGFRFPRLSLYTLICRNDQSNPSHVPRWT